MNRTPGSVLATLCVLGFAQCASDPTAAPAPAIGEYVIRPSEANASVVAFDEPHYIWVPNKAPATRRMLLLLSGTGGRPANAQRIGRVAAEQGYLVVGLEYPNALAVVEACAADADTNCMARMRDEIIRGEDSSAHVVVDPANSISGRLRDLLQLLATRHPADGWADFLDQGEVRWSAIAVGGLSQGGGHAAYIAKLYDVPRVIMFGAPADGFNGVRAPWMTLGATPAANYYGFRHQRDPFTSITPNWMALGLDQFGAAQVVETAGPGFGGSHMLLTDLLPATGTYADAHPSVYGDGATPKRADGTARFEDAWRYLLGTP